MIHFVLLIVLWNSYVFAASTDPAVSWRTLRTPHFELIYDKDQRELANVYAKAAEQAYEILKTRFSEMPSKTYLVLMDNTDETNGASTFLPYPMIQVYPVLPDTLSTLDYYGNWPLEMIMHEYTHILTFEPAHGFYVPLHYIFGTVIHPNGILPHWYLEGLAVESESRYTEFGRLKSPRTAAELRGIVQDGAFKNETIDRLNESLIPEYPYGERPYLFGSILWEHMMKMGPPETVDQLNQDYGRRFPFLVQRPAEDIFGINYQRLLAETYDGITFEAQKQIETVDHAKKESYQKFNDDGMEQFSPVISPDGHHLIYLTSGLMRGQVREIDRTDSTSFSQLKSHRIYDLMGSLRLSWSPDSKSFVFDQLDEMDHYHNYREIYRFNLKSQSARQLTYGLRAQEPAVSPDGRTVAFIANSGANQWLGIVDLRKTKNDGSGEHNAVQHLLDPPILERLSHPEFISKTQIAFTHRNLAGQEHLEVYNIKTGQTKVLLPGQNEIRHPRLTKLGLLVATTSSGIQNMAIADLKNQKIEPLTNTETEIQTADWDPLTKELVATRMTGKGRRLVATAPAGVQPPTIGRLVPADWPEVPRPADISTDNFEEGSYQPAEYMWPRYWTPFAYPVYNGVYVQGATSMSDPAGINTYTASIAYDTVTNHGSFGFQYVNSSLPPDIELSYVKQEDYLVASGLILDEQTVIADLSFFIPGLNRNWKGMAGYIWDQMDTPWSERYLRSGAIAGLTYANWNDPRTESAGTIIGVTHEQFLPEMGRVAYGRTVLGATQAWTAGLPRANRIVATARAVFAPDLPMQDVIPLGDGSLGASYLVSLSNSQFLMRGYPNSTFIGRKLLNYNLEYQLPLSKDASGWGTFPLFNRGWDLALFTDGISVDGGGYNPGLEAYETRDLSQFALSTGVEARWNSTIAYNLPITWIFGLYFGFDRMASDTVMPFVGLALSDLSIIDHLQQNWFKHW